MSEKKLPDCIWVNNYNGYLVGENYPNSTLYFSEEAVKRVLMREMVRINGIICLTTGDIGSEINANQVIESVINDLKGGTK